MKEFNDLCQDLSYTTETDSELTPFEGLAPDFDGFFNTQIAINKSEETETGDTNAARWSELKNWMKINLTNVKVIKRGEVETSVLVFGEKNGRVIGFEVSGVET